LHECLSRICFWRQYSIFISLKQDLKKFKDLPARFRDGGMIQVRAFLKTLIINRLIRSAYWLRQSRVQCPYCGWHGYEFLSIDCGTFVVPRAECPNCHSQERHRLLYEFLRRTQQENLKRDKKAILHIAPELQINNWGRLYSRHKNYGIDLNRDVLACMPGRGTVGDILRMPFSDGTFDSVLCLHVLEHVADDRQAIRELYRIVKPGGQMTIMVPFMMGLEATIEYGAPDKNMFDHVRAYSPHDFHDKLDGIRYSKITPLDVMTKEEAERFRIPLDSQIIYLCTK
jgi:SAM-dependent methyltransferase